MANTYDLGDLVRVSGSFTNSAGAAQDPTAVKVSICDPSGSVTTYVYLTDIEVAKDTTGNYHIDIDADMAGWWSYRWWSTGTGQAADEGYFRVLEARAL